MRLVKIDLSGDIRERIMHFCTWVPTTADSVIRTLAASVHEAPEDIHLTVGDGLVNLHSPRAAEPLVSLFEPWTRTVVQGLNFAVFTPGSQDGVVLTLLVVDLSGNSIPVDVKADEALTALLCIYCARTGFSPARLFLTKGARRLPLEDTPAQHGMENLDIVTVMQKLCGD